MAHPLTSHHHVQTTGGYGIAAHAFAGEQDDDLSFSAGHTPSLTVRAHPRMCNSSTLLSLVYPSSELANKLAATTREVTQSLAPCTAHGTTGGEMSVCTKHVSDARVSDACLLSACIHTAPVQARSSVWTATWTMTGRVASCSGRANQGCTLRGLSALSSLHGGCK
jgi:hypothetical protein